MPGFLDLLTGRKQIESMRRQADQHARDQYDPTVLNPLLQEANLMATEGIADEPLREQTLETIFGRTNVSEIPGAGSGRSLSFMERLNQQRVSAMAEAEGQISMAEEAAQREGRGRVATLMSRMKEIENMRNAKIHENRLMAEAEASRRRRAFGSAIGKLAGTVAGSFLGPGGAALGGTLGGALFGGGTGAVAGGLTGALTSADIGSEDINKLSDADLFGGLFSLFGSGNEFEDIAFNNPNATAGYWI